MATDGRAESRQAQVGKKDLKLITEVALGTVSSVGIKEAFQEYWTKPTPGLFYTLSHCTFPLLEDVMKAIIEVAADGPEDLPKGLYSRESHGLRWLQQKMRAPTVFEAGEYKRFIADVNKNLRESRANHMPLARLQRESPLLAGYSVFENVIKEASRVWPQWKYLELEADERERVDLDLLPLAFDLSRWLLIEVLRYEKAHSKVAASFPEMEQYMLDLLRVSD